MTKLDRNRVTALAAALVALVAGYAARAASGGATKSKLSFAGTLRDDQGHALASPQALTFAFKHGALVCTAPADSGPIDAQTGAFHAEIDLAGCPANLFDGSDVTVDVSVGGKLVAADQPVNPVPYAKYADRVGSPDCPLGYARDAAATCGGPCIVCKNVAPDGQLGDDEIVKVESGAAAFWIDRYEATLFDTNGNAIADASQPGSYDLPQNGQWLDASKRPHAKSKRGVAPTHDVTWFQALSACAEAGKRMPTRREWFLAARGTPDPGDSDGSQGKCSTDSAQLRPTGIDGPTPQACVSGWGAEDMIGNLAEWTDEWYASLNDTPVFVPESPWPDASYQGDGVANVRSEACTNVDCTHHGPAAAFRGGSRSSGVPGGTYFLHVTQLPSTHLEQVGFRCVVPR